MKIQLILIIGFVTLAGCSQSRQSETHASESKIKGSNSNEIRRGSLNEQQLKEIKRIHHAFSEVNSVSLEETIDDFKHDKDPDRKIAICLVMVDAYERFTVNKHVEEHDKKQEAYDVILLRSMTSEEEVLKKIKFSYLSNDEVKEIFSYYVAPPKPKPISIKKR